VPLEIGRPLDVSPADMAAIHIFIGDREYTGRVAIRPFDPARPAPHAARLLARPAGGQVR
jgi:hypothetical protein